jgi:hypothetical protein
MGIVLLAALCMVFQDVLAVMMVQAEARDRGWLAGILDAVGWGFAIATTTVSVTALQGHNTGLKVAVVVFVTIANIIGSKLGQVLGTKFIKPLPSNTDKLLIDKGIITEEEWKQTKTTKKSTIYQSVVNAKKKKVPRK